MKIIFQMASVVFFALPFVSCEPTTPRNTAENLPPQQNSRPAEKVKKNTSPTTTPVISKTPDTEAAGSPIEVKDVEGIKTDINPLVISRLKIPVAGVPRSALRDTFKDSRSEGRIHDAIDIMAAEDTPVIAAADGEIARFFDSEKGGITIYQFSADKKLIFYYAHLKRRAENLQEKMPVKQGQVIGYVGDTGNAGTGNFHLHFAIWYVTDPKEYWNGLNINPYPLLN